VDGIKVLLFGAAADRAGTRETVVSAGGITLDELWPLLAE
jgi:molybdopterin converting factor small subunit